VITHNEEHNLQECLESVRFADEIVVVDSHSADRTVEIAKTFTERVVVRDWPGHVAQKNFAADQASGDWILAIDADERVTDELREEIQTVLAQADGEPKGYRFPRKTWYLGRWWTRGGWYPDLQLRLWRRGCARWGGCDPHDRVELDGRPGRLQGELLHYSYRGIADHLRTLNFFTSVAARAKEKRGVRFRATSLFLRPPARFLRMYVLQGAWREGVAGFIMATIGAFYVFSKYAKMYERQRLGIREPERRR
jgi:glycosyltransferase involved in cell wall biosynthesis